MSLLARLQYLGLAKEVTPKTYLAATEFIPITSPKPEDVVEPLKDESIAGNDAVVQGIYGGPAHSTFDYTIAHAYSDVIGDHLRAMIGPDTIAAGITTALSSATTVGATSISVALSIPSGSTIRIDTGALAEYAITGAPSGAGPYTIPLTSTGSGTALAKAHASGAAVVSQTTHVFAQDARVTAIPSYSLTQYNGIETRGYPGCIMSDLGVKIDPKGAVSVDAKWQGLPSAVQSTVAPTWSGAQPFLGWNWTTTVGGVASTKNLSADYMLKRATAPIEASEGTQGPREIFSGALELDTKIKAIFEDDVEYLQFLSYTYLPIVSTLTQGLVFGGAVLALTTNGAKYTKFVPDFTTTYLTCDIDSTSSFNATDAGLLTVTLKNFVSTAY